MFTISGSYACTENIESIGPSINDKRDNIRSGFVAISLPNLLGGWYHCKTYVYNTGSHEVGMSPHKFQYQHVHTYTLHSLI
jgi:hypothetical protein